MLKKIKINTKIERDKNVKLNEWQFDFRLYLIKKHKVKF